jgi:hypothetical protein
VRIDECITEIDHGKVWGSIGGMSGGPVIAWRRGSIVTAELIGFIYEYGENFDLMYVRSASLLRPDGRLNA